MREGPYARSLRTLPHGPHPHAHPGGPQAGENGSVLALPTTCFEKALGFARELLRDRIVAAPGDELAVLLYGAVRLFQLWIVSVLLSTFLPL
jgi:hypothetical protein